MTHQLIIWMGVDPYAPWYWTMPDGAHGHANSQEDKAKLSDMDVKDMAVIIAGQSVTILPHELPKMNNKDRLSAAGFAVEDNIAESLAEQHIVLGHKDDMRMAIITKSKMEMITNALRDAGFEDIFIFADFDALSMAARNLRVGARVICAKPLGYTLDQAWHNPNDKVEIVNTPQDLYQYIDFETAINLRQNEFAPRRSFTLSGVKVNLKSLSRIAALFLLCGLSWLGLQASLARSKGQEATFVKSETARVYADVTGQTVQNPALAATRAIQSEPTQNTNFLSLSHLLFQAVEQTDGIIIESIQYDKRRAELSLRIIYPGFASTTDLENAVANLGGVFEAGGVREQGGRFIGDAGLRLGARL